MRKICVRLSLLLLVLILLFAAGCGAPKTKQTEQPAGGQEQKTSQDQGATVSNGEQTKVEQTVDIGTIAVGTSYNAIATGIGNTVSNHSSIQATVKPFAVSSTWIPLLNKGDIDIGDIAAPEAYWSLTGTGGKGFDQKNGNVRMLVRGTNISLVSLAVRADSGIKTPKDLKGKKVASGFGGGIGHNISEAALALGGLTWNDVKQVAVPEVVGGMDALRDGRVDATFGVAATQPKSLEVDAAIGIDGINVLDLQPEQLNTISKEQLKTLQANVPGGQFVVIKGGTGYIDRDIISFGYPWVLVASAQMTEETAYEVVKAMWNNYEEIQPVHAWVKNWTSKDMFDPKPPVPYHDGAIKFFKEQGLWTEEASKYQQELLSKI